MNLFNPFPQACSHRRTRDPAWYLCENEPVHRQHMRMGTRLSGALQITRDHELNKDIAEQSIELALAMPPIMLDRLLRMLRLGLQPTSEDLQELNRMWAEKAYATTESCDAMARELIDYQQKILRSASALWATPWMIPAAIAQASMRHAPGAMERMAAKGLEPIHRRVLANAQRLDQQGNTHK